MVRSHFFIVVIVLTSLIPSFSPAMAGGPKRYHEGETEHGYAAWYGDEYQGKATSDGEIFDKHQFTAAHRHLPFGTIVRVVNRDNGRSVEVRINDRGPFDDDDRIINVSEAAADVLRMKRSGTVRVEIEVVRLGSPGRANQG